MRFVLDVTGDTQIEGRRKDGRTTKAGVAMPFFFTFYFFLRLEEALMGTWTYNYRTETKKADCSWFLFCRF